MLVQQRGLAGAEHVVCMWLGRAALGVAPSVVAHLSHPPCPVKGHQLRAYWGW